MSQQNGDLEQWQIAEQNPDESWSSYAKSTTRTPKKLLIITLTTLVLGGAAFAVGLFLADQSSSEVAATPSTPTPSDTTTEITDVNTLLNDVAQRLDTTTSEPYLVVQIYNSCLLYTSPSPRDS